MEYQNLTQIKEEQNPTQVVIGFQITDIKKRRDMLTYLRQNPKHLWDWFQRVRDGYTVMSEEEFKHVANWHRSEITRERVNILQINDRDSDIIEYEVTLINKTKDPKNLVDVLRGSTVSRYDNREYHSDPRLVILVSSLDSQYTVAQPPHICLVSHTEQPNY